MKIQVPDLNELIGQRATTATASDEEMERVQSFFNIPGKPNKMWLSKIEPGVRAAQAVLNAYMAEQITGDAYAIERNRDEEELVAKVKRIFGPKAKEIIETLDTKLANGSTRFQVRFNKGDEGTEINIANSMLDEPAMDLIPAPLAPVENPTELDDLVRVMAPRVRLEGKPATAASILSAVSAGKWTRKISMLIPMYDDVAPAWTYHLAAQIRKQPWVGLDYEKDTVIQRSRNLLAHKFLKSEAEWSFWIDSDIITPFGDPAFFYLDLGISHDYVPDKFAGMMAIERLMKAGHTIVGGVYQARRPTNAKVKSPMVIQPCLHPRNQQDIDLTEELRRHGPIDKVVQVGYVATGCALIHRSVYQAIMSRFPERAPKKEGDPFDFFGHDVARGGEDISFCGLASQAGHQSYLDCGLWCAHLGRYAYFPSK